MTRRILVVALALAAAVPANAERAAKQSPLKLSDTLAAALARNPDLEIAAIDVDMAAARVVSARGAAEDLVFDASVTGSASRLAPIPGAPVQLLEADSVSVGAGVTKPLSTGGAVGLKWEGPFGRQKNRLVSGDQSVDSTSRNYTSRVTLEFSQPLLRGAGTDSSRAAVRRERARVKAASATHEATATQIVRDAIVAYWELAYAADELAIRRESATLAREHQRIVHVQIDKGDKAKIASAEVDMEVALRDEEVAIAETTLAERSLELSRIMGAEIDPDAALLLPGDEVVFDIAMPTRADALAAALERNPQLRAYKLEERARGVEIAAAEDQTSPALDFRSSAQAFGSDEGPTDAAGGMFGYDSVVVEAGVFLTIPIGRREARGRLAEARGARRRVNRQYEAARRQIQVATARAFNRVQLAAKRIDVLSTATANAVRVIALDKRRFELGSATSFDVLRRQQELAEAQLRQRRARTDHAIAVAELFALTGGLLELFGIDLA